MGIDRCVCYVFLSELTSYPSIKKTKDFSQMLHVWILYLDEGATWPHEQVEEMAVGKSSRHMRRIWEMKP